jgi:hypothetical protein
MKTRFARPLLIGLGILVGCNAGDDSKTGNEADKPNGGVAPGPPAVVEPTPFKNEGLHEVGRFSQKEIELTAVRYLGSKRSRSGPVCTWEIDYRFVGDGFRPSTLSDAYELRIRATSADKYGNPPETAWKIHHRGNKGRFLNVESRPAMMQPKGTVKVTWLTDPRTLGHPHVFWIYRTEPKSDDLYLRVSNFVGTKGESQPR